MYICTEVHRLVPDFLSPMSERCAGQTVTSVAAQLPMAFIFDMDGTLIDTHEALTCAVLAGLRAVGAHPCESEVRERNKGSPLEELFESFAAERADAAPERFDAFVAAFKANYDACAILPELCPGVRDGLEALRREFPSVPFAVATTKPTACAVIELAEAKLSEFFPAQRVQGTDPPIKPKPEPDVILEALRQCRKHGLSSCLREATTSGWVHFYVGDTERDIQAARAAGAIPICVCYEPQKREMVESWRGDAVITDMTQLPAAVAAILGG